MEKMFAGKNCTEVLDDCEVFYDSGQWMPKHYEGQAGMSCIKILTLYS